ncbi:hypothetical protein [Microcoleus sp. FACHB-672]|uniref:hypothetical protein n=1 Tax=Microcoleus sp. FACHB-672 TaxID=2692825 RepID=UPI001F5526AF|nr:hypothetical protein [Microcoleus sp. FACHB-672]
MLWRLLCGEQLLFNNDDLFSHKEFFVNISGFFINFDADNFPARKASSCAGITRAESAGVVLSITIRSFSTGTETSTILA